MKRKLHAETQLTGAEQLHMLELYLAKAKRGK